MFRYRLQRALEFMELRETQKKMDIGNSRERIRLLKLHKDSLEMGIQALLARCRTNLQNHLAWLPFESDQVTANSKQIKNTEEQIEKEYDRLNDLMYELNEISKKRKGLESLKEQRLKDYKLNESRRDQKRLDDVFQILKR